MTSTVETPTDLVQQSQDHVVWAKSLAITNPFEFEEAGNRLKEIKAMAKQMVDFFTPMKRQADAAKKSILDREKESLGPLQTAEAICKSAMIRFQQEENRKAEQLRQETQAKIDEDHRKQREALEKRAAAAKKPETQQRLAEQAASIVAPVVAVPAEVPKMAGVSIRKVWRAKVIDETIVPREFLMVNEKQLAQYATAMKEKATVPGVQFYTEDSMAVGSR